MLNRLEGRFKESLPVYEDSQVIDAIMGYIVSAKETAIQNERIKSVLEQLPLRFTKAKFSAIVSQALSIYEGTDQEELKTGIKDAAFRVHAGSAGEYAGKPAGSVGDA